jgi:hypothetical protein
VQFFTLTLHGNGGILYRTECGETEFVIGQEAAPDVFTVSDASVAQRHAMLWVGSQKLQVEQLEGETLVNGYTIKERVEVDYPASVQTGDVTLLIEPMNGGGQLHAGAEGVSGVRVAMDASSAERSFSGSGHLETAAEHAAHQGIHRIAGEIARGGMGCIYTAEAGGITALPKATLRWTLPTIKHSSATIIGLTCSRSLWGYAWCRKSSAEERDAAGLFSRALENLPLNPRADAGHLGVAMHFFTRRQSRSRHPSQN